MRSNIGWILDVYVKEDEAIIWLRTEDNEIIKLRDYYWPSLYILPKTVEDGERLLSILQNQPHIRRATWVGRYINLSDKKRKKLLQIFVDGAFAYRQIVRGLERLDQVAELFNIDLLHIQQYLFTKLRIEPTSKVKFLSDSNGCLTEIRKINDDKEIAPPPFTALHFNINAEALSLTPNPQSDPITSIKIRFDDEENTIDGSEDKILKEFELIVKEKDADFLVTPNCDEFALPYLHTRAKILNFNIQLGREQVDLGKLNRSHPCWIKGRVALDHNYYGLSQDEWGIAGLVERSRFGFLPPGIAGRWTANRVNDSRVCYELLQRGYVIPKNTGYYEYIRSIEEIIQRDKGGMIIPPRIGEVHTNVAELDYESQYPNLIVKECLSFETVTPRGVRRKKDAILPLVTKKALERRLYFKRLRKSFPKGSREWLWCEQRQNALKLVLVCIYGTSGCCWNRFGNVLTFEEINRRSRQIMIKTKDYVQSRGYDLIHAIVDSYFLKKEGATKEDYERIAQELSKLTKLPISLDHHYKFLLLLPLESDPSLNMEAQMHYFGMLYNGEIVARGIELRRHDTPKFIKDFQARLIQVLFNCKNSEEVHTVGYGKALQLVKETIDRLRTGEVPVEELVVSKILRKPITQYKSMFPHVSAAIQLESRGKKVKEGEPIDFMFVDANHHNPLCRVIAYELINSKINQDKEKYKDMILDAAETVLSTFGFSREILE